MTPEAGLGGLCVCTDAAATAGLAAGSHAVAIPLGRFLRIPHGLATTNAAPWCMRMRCYAPTSLTGGYVSFYSLEQDNDADAALFCSIDRGCKLGSLKWNGADSGYAGAFTLGAWHELVVSFDGTTAFVYVDGTENRVLGRAGAARRAESLLGKDFIHIAADDDGDDQLIYVDEIQIYDAARPHAVFPLDVAHQLETLPWQQNVYTNRFTVMCETKALVPGLELQYGEGYATNVQMTYASGYDGRYLYSGRVTLDGCPGASVPYRLAVGGTPLAADGERSADGTVRLWPDDPDESFTCSIWGDNQQGAHIGDWDADKYLYVSNAFRQMVAHDVDFGITSGDISSGAKYEAELRPCLLDTTDEIFGRTRPYYLAWGNHDTDLAPKSRAYCETGSLNDPTFLDSKTGAYCLYRGNVLFAFVHWQPDATVAKWLADLLATPRAKAAKFRVLIQHAPMYLEVWGDNLDNTLLETAHEGGIDIVFSGHMHAYERIVDDKGLVQLTNGGMGYLDHYEEVVNNYGSWTKLGGHMPVPYLWARQSSVGVLGKMGPVRMGCITSYCELSVSGNELNVRAFGFNADGSPIGVFDDFTLVSKTVSAPAASAASAAACADPSSFDAFTETPVTNAKWKEYKDAVGEPFAYASGKGESPVVNVSKTEIGRFLAWLNAGTSGGTVYRLPTLAELTAKRTTLAGEVTEWTDTVDESTGWCRLLGGNALASNGVWLAATDKPAIATAGCHANYLGFRLVKGEAPEPSEPTPVYDPTADTWTFRQDTTYGYATNAVYGATQATFEENASLVITNGSEVIVSNLYLGASGNVFDVRGGGKLRMTTKTAAQVANATWTFNLDGGSVYLYNTFTWQATDTVCLNLTNDAYFTGTAANTGLLTPMDTAVWKVSVTDSEIKFKDYDLSAAGCSLKLDNSTLKGNWGFVMGSQAATLELCGAAPFLRGANGPITLGANLTLNLRPEKVWSATEGRIHSTASETATKATVSLASGVKYNVDVSAFAGLTTNFTFCLLSVPNTPCTRSINLPEAANVTVSGTDADKATVTFTKSDDNRYVYVTVAMGATPAYPSWIDSKDAATQAKYAAWSAKYGVKDPSSASQAAYLLNCSNDAAVVEAEKKNFRIAGITVGADGAVTVDPPTGDYNGTVRIGGDSDVTGDYLLDQSDPAARFFRAFLEYTPSN